MFIAIARTKLKQSERLSERLCARLPATAAPLPPLPPADAIAQQLEAAAGEAVEVAVEVASVGGAGLLPRMKTEDADSDDEDNALPDEPALIAEALRLEISQLQTELRRHTESVQLREKSMKNLRVSRRALKVRRRSANEFQLQVGLESQLSPPRELGSGRHAAPATPPAATKSGVDSTIVSPETPVNTLLLAVSDAASPAETGSDTDGGGGGTSGARERRPSGGRGGGSLFGANQVHAVANNWNIFSQILILYSAFFTE